MKKTKRKKIRNIEPCFEAELGNGEKYCIYKTPVKGSKKIFFYDKNGEAKTFYTL